MVGPAIAKSDPVDLLPVSDVITHSLSQPNRRHRYYYCSKPPPPSSLGLSTRLDVTSSRRNHPDSDCRHRPFSNLVQPMSKLPPAGAAASSSASFGVSLTEVAVLYAVFFVFFLVVYVFAAEVTSSWAPSPYICDFHRREKASPATTANRRMSV